MCSLWNSTLINVHNVYINSSYTKINKMTHTGVTALLRSVAFQLNSTVSQTPVLKCFCYFKSIPTSAPKLEYLLISTKYLTKSLPFYMFFSGNFRKKVQYSSNSLWCGWEAVFSPIYSPTLVKLNLNPYRGRLLPALCE